MIDYARPFDGMCEYMPPTPPAPARLDDFQVFKKVSYTYDAYYRHYDGYCEPEVEAAAGVYHSLVAARDYRPDDWKYKVVALWTEEDTVSWAVDCVVAHGYNEYDVPVHNLRLAGSELRALRREELAQRVSHPRVEPHVSRAVADVLYEVLRARLGDELLRPTYPRYDDYRPEPQVLDLDAARAAYAPDYRADAAFVHADSGDDAEDVFRSSGTASPEASDESKSGDEDDKRKIFKRPPGRPKGTGRKVCKRPRSVSVPEFLRNLLFDEKYCPSIIKWEDHAQGKFRFVKPDEVAKLWGQMKQNDNMTFEKFSRAMRYHYRQAVLVSVPTARLVYQFGHKGPDFRSDNPNFRVKPEADDAYGS